jgi:hypothetical protein
MAIIVAGGSESVTAVEFLPIKTEAGKLIVGNWSTFGYLKFARPKYPSIGIIGSSLIFVGGKTDKNALAHDPSALCELNSNQLKSSERKLEARTQRLSSNETTFEYLDERSYDLINNCWTLESVLNVRIKTARYDHSTALVTKRWCKTVQGFHVL